MNGWFALYFSPFACTFAARVAIYEAGRAREAAQAAPPMRLGYLDAHLTRRDHPLAEFSGGEAALVAVLYWARHIPMDLGPYPATGSYYQRQLTRPSIARCR